MKKLLYLFLCVSAGLACTQTQTQEQPVTSTETDPQTDTADFALPLDSAIVYARRYDSLVSLKLEEPTPIRAYTIRATDLLEVLGIPNQTRVNNTAVRVYLGIDLNNNFRLFLTPVDNANFRTHSPGADKILSGIYRRGDKTDAAMVSAGQYVLDFTSPCPATCPASSPFNPPLR